MKRPTMLVEASLRQAELDLDLSVERDVATLRRRCEHEGLPFLTVTLPTLSDALERGLECGLFSCPSSFARHGRLPRFLGGFFNRVFNLDGGLREDACPLAVKVIRQVCRFFKKLKVGCSEAINRKAAQHFLDVEGELRMLTPQVEREDYLLDKISGIIWSQVFPEIDPLDLVCHHGPGNTAEKLLLNERWLIRSWNARQEYLYPSDLHCFPNYGIAAQVSGLGIQGTYVNGPKILELKDESPVRVVFVPKTATTPRVIAIEPSHVQYVQQSVKDYVYKVLEAHALTKRSIRFTRQDVNQELARKGSIDKRTTTLDLKDASDRVHLHLVQRIFKTSGLLEYLEDARSLHAILPYGQNVVLHKYASMGSALCFPVEAMVFYTLVQCAMHMLDGIRPSSRSIERYSKSISIYGDDIIVPVEYTDVVVRYLESYALKVNVGKSFSKGNFRESCGADYFKGVAVNPVYARQIPHDNAHEWGPEHVMSWTATADLFYRRGEWIVAQAIREMVQRVVRRPIPKTTKVGSGVAFFSYFLTTDLRYDGDLQCWKQKRLHYDPVKRKDSIDGNELACLNFWGYSSYAQTISGSSGNRDSSRPRHSFAGMLEDLSRPGFSRSLGIDCDSSWGKAVSPRVGEGVSDLQGLDDSEERVLRAIPDLGSADIASHPTMGAYERVAISEHLVDNYLTDVQSDPLKYLDGDTRGLDFATSTKRGCFKSKSRWTSLAG